MTRWAVLFLCILTAGRVAGADIIRVTPTGTDPAGASWDTPASLVNALANASNNDEIWLAQGIYSSAATFTVQTNCALYGGFTNGMAARNERDGKAYPTILDGNGQNLRVVTVTGTNVTLDGLVISNSYGSAAGGITKTTAGSLTLANCRIVNHEGRTKSMKGLGGYFAPSVGAVQSILLTNCVVANNTISGSTAYSGSGFGIYSLNANLRVVDCVFSNQYGVYNDTRTACGVGLYFNNGTLSVLRTDFIDNRAGANNYGGGAAVCLAGTTAASFSNCLFRGNQGLWQNNTDQAGAALWVNMAAASTATLANCTFYDNLNDTGNGGAIRVSSGAVVLKNSILWNNSVRSLWTGKEIYMTGGSLSADHCALTGLGLQHVYVVGGSATFSNCMTNDPLFASATDLRLQSPIGRWDPALGDFVTTDTTFSPYIDAGNPADSVGLEPAPNDDRINLGAYGGTAQASKSGAAAPQVASHDPLTNDYTRMVLRGELTNRVPVLAAVGFCYGTTSIAGETTNGWDAVQILYPQRQAGGMVFSVTTPYLMTNTTYYYRCFASNAAGMSWAPVASFATGPAYPLLHGVGGGADVIHVRAGATGAADGTDWNSAFTRIADAIPAIRGSRTNIWITSGTYSEGVRLLLTNSATLVGGFAGTETAVSGRAATNAAGVVTNYTVINGNESNQCLLVTGGNVWLDTLSVTKTDRPRALEKSGTGNLVLNNCRIEENQVVGWPGSLGLGAYFSGGTVLITNCVFRDNQLPSTTVDSYSWIGLGLYGSGVTLTIVDSAFSGQDGDPYRARTLRGAGLGFQDGTLQVIRTEFVGNSASDNNGGGGAVYLGNGTALSATFSNCLFRANYVPHANGNNGYGGAVYAQLNASRSASFVNCTFTANTNANNIGLGGAIHLSEGTLNLKNCILWANRCTGTSASGDDLANAVGTVNASYSSLTAFGIPQIYGMVNFSNCREGDPLFASATDLHLQSKAGRWDPAAGDFITTDAEFSPCIDAGDPTDSIGDEPTDNGNIRINMGAYGGTAEAGKSPPATPPLPANRDCSVLYNRASISGELINDTFVSAQIYLCYGTTRIPGDTTNGWDGVKDVGEKQNGAVFSTWTPALLPETTYYYRWHAVNNAGSNWTAAASFETGVAGPGGGADVIHVDRLATGAGDGSDWANAYTKIVDGISAISGTRTNLWITGVTYGEGALLTLSKSAALVGGFAGTETAVAERALINAFGVVTNYTVISGEASHRCLSVTAGDVLLDSLVFSNCPISQALSKSGGGALTMANCRIEGNSGVTDGVGGYFTAGSVLMTNCVVTGNRATTYHKRGFGIWSSGAQLQIVDCVFASNSNEDGVGTRGTVGVGLAFNNGTLNVLRTDFIGNKAGANNTGGGAGVYVGNTAGTAASFSNCVFRDNVALLNAPTTPGYGGAMWLNLPAASTARVVNCTFKDNINSNGNGGAIYLDGGTLVLKNSILWTNAVAAVFTGSEIFATNAVSRATVSYSDLTGSNVPHVVTGGGAVVEYLNGVISADPQFASATDAHLRSRGGRRDPEASSWVRDAVTSPCIDAGDPADSVGLEPRPNGGVINMGAYGGTIQASLSAPRGSLILVR